jgi:hypothetical protein
MCEKQLSAKIHLLSIIICSILSLPSPCRTALTDTHLGFHAVVNHGVPADDKFVNLPVFLQFQQEQQM